MRRLFAVILTLGFASGVVLAGVLPTFEDSFDSNPCEPGSGWICQGSTATVAGWVPPGADICADPNTFDPANPCSLYDDGDTAGPDTSSGYVLVTTAVGNESGNMFREDLFKYDNFKMTVVVELRDGSIGRPADGMCVVIVGQTPGENEGDPPIEGPPGIGAGGGAMGSTGLNLNAAGKGPPHLIFEFDNWSCNTGDNNDQNHVQIAYGSEGFPAVDSIPISPAPKFFGKFVKVNEATWPLNNRQAPPAPPNRFVMEVFAQKGTFACNLTNDDSDPALPRTRFYTYKVPGFEAFDGYLGVTASTGGAWQNQILHYAKVETLDPGFCLQAPADIARDFQSSRTPDANCGDFQEGDVIPVTLTITGVRAADEQCTAPNSVIVKETLPADWAPSQISDGGTFDDATDTITWTVNTPTLAAGKVLSYKITASGTTDLQVFFVGDVRENIALSEPSPIGGKESLTRDTPFDACGAIRCWNILGAYMQPGTQTGDNPGEDNMRLDYLTDGEQFESDFTFYPGAQIATAFGGDGITGAQSIGINNGALGHNPNGVPEVFAWNDGDGYINLNDDVFGGDPNTVMSYQQAYVINNTGSDIETYIRSDSDDSIQILLNGEEAWIHSIARGSTNACAPPDVSPDGVNFVNTHLLAPGSNSLMVKTFEGGGGWNSTVIFTDEIGTPITEGLTISKYPPGLCVFPAAKVARAISGTPTVQVLNTDQPGWKGGDTYDVSLTVSDIRGNPPSCTPPTAIKVEENVPAGWTPSAPSAGGVVAGQKITWNLTGGQIAPGSLTYKVTAAGTGGTVQFRGSVSDPGSIGKGAVTGQSLLYNPVSFTDQCFITQWLLLGPYKQPGAIGTANPPVAQMRRDHLTDGAGVNELDIEPVDGMQVNTKYGVGGARSTGLEPTVAPINPGGIPTWDDWQDDDDTIKFENYDGGNEDNVMHYAVTYVDVDSDITVDIGLASDDAVQVLLDGAEIWINSIARGSGNPNEIQDVVAAASTPLLSPLSGGRHKLMVKVFEGGGDHNFRLRFQDPTTGEGVCSGISICLSTAVPCTPVTGTGFHRGDADDNGELQLTDAIKVLGFLFLGASAPPCFDAADADDNGELQLTDAIRILGYLFLGGAAPAPPGPPPSACGIDPTGDDPLDCGSYTSC